MCGRARCTIRADSFPRACHRTGGPSCTVDMDRYLPAYNVSPGFNLPVLRRDDGADGEESYALHCMRWGLVPSFTKKTEKPDFYRMFNARSESVGEKASFRRLLPKNRCLVAFEGFYEWKKDGSKKQPYYIHFKDGRPLVFAALYDSWKNSEGEMLYTFTILTTSSSSALKWLHDRMPVILGNKEAIDTWLYGSSSFKYDTLLKPYEGLDLAWYPVTPAMGKPSFDGPECIKEIELKTEEGNNISKFFSRKEIKAKTESNPEERSTMGKSAQTDLPINVKQDHESIKEEPDQEEGSTHQITLKTDLPAMVKKEHLCTKEEESSPEESTNNKTVSTDLLKNMKEEDESENKFQSPSFTKRVHDINSSISALTREEAMKCSGKRHHKEILADSGLNTDKSKLHSSPAKKKTNCKSVGDKQPTLFSYFGKR